MKRLIHLLVIDDDAGIRRTFTDLIGSKPDIHLETASNGIEGLEQLRRSPFDVAVVDLNMPLMGGMEFLRKARQARPDLSVLVFTGNGSIETAVEAMKLGAEDYLTKPFKLSHFQVVLDRVRRTKQLVAENRRLRAELGERYRISGLIGSSPAMRKVHRIVERIRDDDCNVLIMGESGTGKDLVARAIHYDGRRTAGPFVTLDCGSVHSSLLESELFGHLKGAFTGAVEDKVGLIETATGGTLFLDEIGEMPLELQPALLRAIEEKRIRPVGGTEYISVDASTNRNLEKAVEQNRFRRDLYYRLNVVKLELPPLRKRKDDIPSLVEHFCGKFGSSKVRKEAVYQLLRYDWPGNVRELENVIQCAGALNSAGEIGPADLPPLEKASVKPGKGASLRDMEITEIRRLLAEHNGNTGAVAGILGIDRSTLYRKLKRFKIDIRTFRSNGS